MQTNNSVGIDADQWDEWLNDVCTAEDVFDIDELERHADLTRSTGVCYTISSISEGDEQNG